MFSVGRLLPWVVALALAGGADSPAALHPCHDATAPVEHQLWRPLLETDRTRLRPVESSDFPRMMEILGSELNQSMSGDYLPPFVIKMMSTTPPYEHWLTPWENLNFAIVEKDTDTVIGVVAVQRGISNLFRTLYAEEIAGGAQIANIAGSLSADKWSQGYMSEALQALMLFSFIELDLDRLTAYTQLSNVASQRLVQAAGFTKVREVPDASGDYPLGTAYFELSSERWKSLPTP
jgi:RimJ/RimL family protein N-acetyltransferase